MKPMKRSVPMYEDGLTYGDFFTGYPSKLKIQKDVADFVSSLMMGYTCHRDKEK